MWTIKMCGIAVMVLTGRDDTVRVYFDPNIIEYDTFEKRLGGNVLFTYRVNSGTVFVGYDDHYRQGRQIDDHLFPTLSMLRTNRAIFTKLQYLFRL